ncbi:CapA family protein [Streptomyces sp. GbtcB6]|uniref:CapA family protein n=1 Tax=Streptomyces sp. GbtcB6 TaxID=2824751 RepID=UPI001C30BE7E|nr:CapA family protein [Streptomyces sp. GbtcB6]
MINRRRQAALALTALLAAAAACQNHVREERAVPPGHPAPAVPATGGFTLVAAGDVMPQKSAVDHANFDAGGNGYDFRPMLAGVEPVVSRADLALCHLATVTGTDGARAGGLTSPPQLAEALAATGYDGCSTASDRALDDGAAGIQRTLDALDRVGLRHSGTARTDAEAGTLTLMNAGRARVAQLSYTYDVNGNSLPPGQPWAVGLLDENRVLADARAARQAGADVVVVSVHWGTEGTDAPDQQQMTLAKRLTAARTGGRPDIDLLLGTHAHIPQAYEKVNGTWVVYGLGDQVAGEMYNSQRQQDPRGNESTLARFTFTPPTRPGGRWEVAKAEFIPQLYDLDAGRVVDLNAAIGQGADFTAARDAIRDVVLSRGAAKDGLVMGE